MKAAPKAQEPHRQHLTEPGVEDPEPIRQKQLDPVTKRMKSERSDPKDISGPPLDNKGRPIPF